MIYTIYITTNHFLSLYTVNCVVSLLQNHHVWSKQSKITLLHTSYENQKGEFGKDWSYLSFANAIHVSMCNGGYYQCLFLYDRVENISLWMFSPNKAIYLKRSICFEHLSYNVGQVSRKVVFSNPNLAVEHFSKPWAKFVDCTSFLSST